MRFKGGCTGELRMKKRGKMLLCRQVVHFGKNTFETMSQKRVK